MGAPRPTHVTAASLTPQKNRLSILNGKVYHRCFKNVDGKMMYILVTVIFMMIVIDGLWVLMIRESRKSPNNLARRKV